MVALVRVVVLPEQEVAAPARDVVLLPVLHAVHAASVIVILATLVSSAITVVGHPRVVQYRTHVYSLAMLLVPSTVVQLGSLIQSKHILTVANLYHCHLALLDTNAGHPSSTVRLTQICAHPCIPPEWIDTDGATWSWCSHQIVADALRVLVILVAAAVEYYVLISTQFTENIHHQKMFLKLNECSIS